MAKVMILHNAGLVQCYNPTCCLIIETINQLLTLLPLARKHATPDFSFVDWFKSKSIHRWSLLPTTDFSSIESVQQWHAFAGAPVVNALISILTDPPADGIGSVPKLFWLGVAMAAIGGCIVTKFKPVGAKAHSPPPSVKVDNWFYLSNYNT